MSAPAVTFTVPGIAVPQGSKSAFVQKGRAIIVEGNRAKLRPWRASVADAAAAAMNGGGLITEPVRVHLDIYLPRPKSHYGTGANAETLKESAPYFVATRPDVEKVARAVLDALTGIVYRDDSQVAVLSAAKCYDARPRIAVSIFAVEGVVPK